VTAATLVVASAAGCSTATRRGRLRATPSGTTATRHDQRPASSTDGRPRPRRPDAAAVDQRARGRRRHHLDRQHHRRRGPPGRPAARAPSWPASPPTAPPPTTSRSPDGTVWVTGFGNGDVGASRRHLRGGGHHRTRASTPSTSAPTAPSTSATWGQGGTLWTIDPTTGEATVAAEDLPDVNAFAVQPDGTVLPRPAGSRARARWCASTRRRLGAHRGRGPSPGARQRHGTRRHLRRAGQHHGRAASRWTRIRAPPPRSAPSPGGRSTTSPSPPTAPSTCRASSARCSWWSPPTAPSRSLGHRDAMSVGAREPSSTTRPTRASRSSSACATTSCGAGAKPTGGDLHGIFIAEGDLVLERAVRAGYRVRSVLVDATRTQPLPAAVDPDVPVYAAGPEVVMRITGMAMHRGLIASLDRGPGRPLDDVLAGRPALVVLENVNNPTNLGVIARSAMGLGADGLVLDPSCCDPLYRRASRVSMGEVFALPWARTARFPEGLDPGDRRRLLAARAHPRPAAEPIDDLEFAPDENGSRWCSAPRAQGSPTRRWNASGAGAHPAARWSRLAQRGGRRRDRLLRARARPTVSDLPHRPPAAPARPTTSRPRHRARGDEPRPGGRLLRALQLRSGPCCARGRHRDGGADAGGAGLERHTAVGVAWSLATVPAVARPLRRGARRAVGRCGHPPGRGPGPGPRPGERAKDSPELRQLARDAPRRGRVPRSGRAHPGLRRRRAGW
jgi:hypothetical protein